LRLDETLVDVEGRTQLLFDNSAGDSHGVFALGEIHVGDRVIFNGGLRYDHTASTGGSWNPRGALIFKLGEGSAFKALYGSAFRAPNSFERLYDDSGFTQKSNRSLTLERVTTFELLLEQLVTRHARVTASAYRYQARQLIDVAVDPADGLLQYRNLGLVNGQGVETEVEVDFAGVNGRASYALQRAWDPARGGRLSNSPQHLGAMKVSLPVVHDRARVGLEVRGMSSLRTPRNDVVHGYVVSNLVVSSRRVFHGVESSVGLFNMFDTAFSDPAGEQHVQRMIRQDGRALRLTVAYAF
jgi:iron complex outermembrane receptor protein